MPECAVAAFAVSGDRGFQQGGYRDQAWPARGCLIALLLRGCSGSSGVLQQGGNGGQQVFRQHGLYAEGDAKVSILVLGFVQAADDQHWKLRHQLPQLADELGSIHAGHDVVSDDKVDVFLEVRIPKLLQSPLRIERAEDEVAGSPQDGLTRGCLNGIVINE